MRCISDILRAGPAGIVLVTVVVTGSPAAAAVVIDMPAPRPVAATPPEPTYLAWANAAPAVPAVGDVAIHRYGRARMQPRRGSVPWPGALVGPTWMPGPSARSRTWSRAGGPPRPWSPWTGIRAGGS